MDSRKGSEASPTHSDLIKILPQVSFIHREHGGTLKIGTLRSQPHIHLIWWIFIGYIICPYDSSKSSKYLPHLSEGHVRALEEHFALASCHCWVKDLWHFREAFWVLRVLTLESSYVTKKRPTHFFPFLACKTVICTVMHSWQLQRPTTKINNQLCFNKIVFRCWWYRVRTIHSHSFNREETI